MIGARPLTLTALSWALLVACSSGVEGLTVVTSEAGAAGDGADGGSSNTGGSSDGGSMGDGGADSTVFNDGTDGSDANGDEANGGEEDAGEGGSGGDDTANSGPDAGEQDAGEQDIGDAGQGDAGDDGSGGDASGGEGGEGGGAPSGGDGGEGGEGGTPSDGGSGGAAEGGSGGMSGDGGTAGDAGSGGTPEEEPGCPTFAQNYLVWELTEGDTNEELNLNADFGDVDDADIVVIDGDGDEGEAGASWLRITNPEVTGNVRLLLASSGVPYDAAADSWELEFSIRDRESTCTADTVDVEIVITNQLIERPVTGASLNSVRAGTWDDSEQRFYLLEPDSGEVLVLDPTAQIAASEFPLPGIDLDQAHQIATSDNWIYATVETNDGWQLRRVGKDGMLDGDVPLGYETISNVSLAHAGSRVLVAIDDTDASSYAADGSALSLTALSLSGLSQATSDGSAFAFVMADNAHRATSSQLTGTVPNGCPMSGEGLSISGNGLRWLDGNELHAASASGTCGAGATATVSASTAPLTGLQSGLTLLITDPSDGEFTLFDSGLDEFGLGLALNEAVSPVAIVMSPNYALIVRDSGAPILIQL